MKIGTITFHFAFNQGAVLQCFALQKYLKKQGHDVSVINYCPRYHTIIHSAWRNPFRYSQVFWNKNKDCNSLLRIYLYLKSFARCMYWNISGVDRGNATAFHSFVEENLIVTKEYRTLTQLRRAPPEMDAYISGSDQLWNPELLGGEFDKAYFLDFGTRDKKRITYAVSMGKVQNQSVVEKLKDLCKGLDAISLREYNKADKDAIGRDVHICVDPTLLLSASDYTDVESKEIERDPYIFVYGFQTNESLHGAVKIAQEKYNCCVINGSPKWIKLNINSRAISGYGPDRFLTLIKNAQCIVTNSFHGTAFSVIYKKDFITVPHTTRGKRMEDLLYKLGLSYRLYGGSEFAIEKNIDYEQVDKKLRILRNHSEEYLKMALSGYKGEAIPHYVEDEIEEASNYKDTKGIKAFYGYSLNENLLLQSASGGVASALSEMIINMGGVVFGVAFSDDYRAAEFRCVDSSGKLDILRGSKYIPPRCTVGGKLIFDNVAEKLAQGNRVLFIGCGCHIAALICRLKNKNVDITNLYTVDLICHGPTTQEVYERFFSSLEERFKSRITYFNMRYKKHGWIPPYIKVVFANGKEYIRPLYETDFGFAVRVCLRESCYNCQFKGNGHLSDITIGDFWGLTHSMKEYTKNGVSVMLTRTNKGEELINSLNKDLFLVERVELSRVISHNKMYYSSIKRPDYIDEFRKDLHEKGLHYAVIHSKGYPDYIKLCMKNRIKRLMGLE